MGKPYVWSLRQGLPQFLQSAIRDTSSNEQWNRKPAQELKPATADGQRTCRHSRRSHVSMSIIIAPGVVDLWGLGLGLVMAVRPDLFPG